ncbi:hypothetical protein BpHYR1_033415 [Brachionus plicatilis]|uniref:Uncharacterized protein n=1 Tax=Brachionus plicatilis TaxID=10195 RepID=A0A3M7R887_BRAPC|nr:hypothetical protein BpHYR1_033415 [Brachionus plicatilis]
MEASFLEQSYAYEHTQNNGIRLSLLVCVAEFFVSDLVYLTLQVQFFPSSFLRLVSHSRLWDIFLLASLIETFQKSFKNSIKSKYLFWLLVGDEFIDDIRNA